MICIVLYCISTVLIECVKFNLIMAIAPHYYLSITMDQFDLTSGEYRLICSWKEQGQQLNIFVEEPYPAAKARFQCSIINQNLPEQLSILYQSTHGLYSYLKQQSSQIKFVKERKQIQFQDQIGRRVRTFTLPMKQIKEKSVIEKLTEEEEELIKKVRLKKFIQGELKQQLIELKSIKADLQMEVTALQFQQESLNLRIKAKLAILQKIQLKSIRRNNILRSIHWSTNQSQV